MNESSDTPDKPVKPQDYAGLRAELADLVRNFLPVVDELWPRLEVHKYRWELNDYGLPDGYDKFVASDIIALLIEGLRASASPVTNSHMLTSKPTTTPATQNRHDQELLWDPRC